MADLFDNPLGLCGFEFVEFAAPTPGVLEPLFQAMGFTEVAKHRSKDVVLFRQGDINFIVNREPKSLAGYFASEHGPSACGLAFRVRGRPPGVRASTGARCTAAGHSDRPHGAAPAGHPRHRWRALVSD